jgi:hypothetical protein
MVLLSGFTALIPPHQAAAQAFSHRGYGEVTFVGYPRTGQQDDTQLVAEGLFRWEPTLKRGPWRFDATFDARADSHEMTEHSFDVSYWDRTTRRPALSVARLMASWASGPLTVEVGKQFIRWGKTDILVPTDRFAARDYVRPPSTELLGVTAARLTLARSSDSLEVVYTPRLTPSRAPLLDQRWVVPPDDVAGVPLVDAGADFPRKAQVGVRWNHVGRHVEHSLSFFRGFSHLPLFQGVPRLSPLRLDVRRHYPQLTMYGADAAAPFSWFTIKSEVAVLQSDTPAAAEYVLYVLQLERQYGEWLFLGGYAGEHETRPGTTFRFAPDRGLARAFVGRASRALDANRSIAFESVVRQNGDGVYGKLEYVHAVGNHWRVTATLTGFGGTDDDFLGQYRRNSFGALTVRYSF